MKSVIVADSKLDEDINSNDFVVDDTYTACI